MVMSRFVSGSSEVQMDCDPVRPGSRRMELRQLLERDSAGDPYVYRQGSAARAHALLFPRVSVAVLASLLDFVSTAIGGVRKEFAWYDHADSRHTVRLADRRVVYRQVGPDRYQVEISLQETVDVAIVGGIFNGLESISGQVYTGGAIVTEAFDEPATALFNGLEDVTGQSYTGGAVTTETFDS